MSVVGVRRRSQAERKARRRSLSMSQRRQRRTSRKLATSAAVDGGAEAFLDPKRVDADAEKHVIEAVSMQSRSLIDRHAKQEGSGEQPGWNQALLGALAEAEDGSDSEDWAEIVEPRDGVYGGGVNLMGGRSKSRRHNHHHHHHGDGPAAVPGAVRGAESDSDQSMGTVRQLDSDESDEEFHLPFEDDEDEEDDDLPEDENEGCEAWVRQYVCSPLCFGCCWCRSNVCYQICCCFPCCEPPARQAAANSGLLVNSITKAFADSEDGPCSCCRRCTQGDEGDDDLND